VAGIAAGHPPVEVDDPDGLGGADVLVLGWGSTYGAIQAAVRRGPGPRPPSGPRPPAPPQPLPGQPGRGVKSYRKVLVPEMNLGQLSQAGRADFLVDAKGLNKVNGLPFRPRRSSLPSFATRWPERLNGNGATGAAEEARQTDVAVPSPPRRTGPATRRSAGAPAAGTIRS
jgi:hypothetical protein